MPRKVDPDAPRTWGGEPTSRVLIEAIGEDVLLDRIASDGISLSALAREIGCRKLSFLDWIREQPDRKQRFDDARREAAHAFAEMATDAITSLPADATQAQVAQMRELAHHRRWQAAKTNPDAYGDRQVVKVEADITQLSDEELDAAISRKLAKLQQA